jgi:hypothetical protein
MNRMMNEQELSPSSKTGSISRRYPPGSDNILFITGPVSPPTGFHYRGIGGLYNRGDTEEGVPIEVALSAMMRLNRRYLEVHPPDRVSLSGATYNRATRCWLWLKGGCSGLGPHQNVTVCTEGRVDERHRHPR